MKKKIIIIGMLLWSFNCVFGQNENHKNTYYVLNFSGAKLYEEPSLGAKVIKNIKLGEKIIADEILKTKHSKEIANEFYFEGNFIKIQNDSIRGYVFSTDLTQIKLVLSVNDEDEGITIANIDGKELSKRVVKRIVKIEGKEYDTEDKITEFENVTYTYTLFDGCSDFIYKYKDVTLSEVYYQMIGKHRYTYVTLEGNFIYTPTFDEKKGNEYLFGDVSPSHDLKIIENKDGTFTVSSFYCN